MHDPIRPPKSVLLHRCKDEETMTAEELAALNSPIQGRHRIEAAPWRHSMANFLNQILPNFRWLCWFLPCRWHHIDGHVWQCYRCKTCSPGRTP